MSSAIFGLVVAASFYDATGLEALAKSAVAIEATTGQVRLIRNEGLPEAMGEGQRQSCVPVKDRGSYFTVPVRIGSDHGSEPQEFELVADTGSDSLLVPDCYCTQLQRCAGARCLDTEKSQFFKMMKVHGNKLLSIVQTFGSGTIRSILGTAVVNVGAVTATMNDSVLLMEDQKLNLDAGEVFEGLLGLGPNRPKEQLPRVKGHQELIEMKGFMDHAGVRRFSICASANSTAHGSFSLHTQPVPNALKSVGKMHWALNLTGVSVGNGKAFGPGTAIPDSGTTLILGPKAHVKELFISICDHWDKCSEHYKQKQGQEEKHHILQRLLHDGCQGLDLTQLPKLRFVLASGTETQQIELSGPDYIFEMEQEKVQKVRKHLMGLTVEVPESTGKMQKVCTPAFGVMDMSSEDSSAAGSAAGNNTATAAANAAASSDLNNAVWVMGTPLFSKYTVHYDLKDRSVGFVQGCQACGGSLDVGLLRVQERSTGRFLNGNVRVPHFQDAITSVELEEA